MHKGFAVYILSGEGIEKAQVVAHAFNELLTKLEGICLEGRDFSIAKTKLEEACFFAKNAINFDSEKK